MLSCRNSSSSDMPFHHEISGVDVVALARAWSLIVSAAGLQIRGVVAVAT